MIGRRAFLVVTGGVLVVPLAVAQPAGKVYRIGVLTAQTPEGSHADAFRRGLRELGYVEGQNIATEWRSAHSSEQFPDLAAELVRLRVDVIVASNNPAIQAAQRATKTIPIVMVFAADPVSLGFVASLARPGGNITGLTSQANELQGKRLQLLKETVTNLSRVAVLWDPTEPGRRAQVGEVEAAARAAGVRLRLLEARSPSELDSAFVAMIKEGTRAVLVQASSMLLAQRARIAEAAVKSGLPAMFLAREWVEAGGLMSYSANITDLYRRAAYFVVKILKGAKPSDLPVEQPTKFELVINLKTAKALGLTIPQSVLFRADEVIQ